MKKMMNYDEQLKLVLEALLDGQKRARLNEPPKLYLESFKGLVSIEQEYDILLKLQDDEKILTIKFLPQELRPMELDFIGIKKDYFIIEVLPSF